MLWERDISEIVEEYLNNDFSSNTIDEVIDDLNLESVSLKYDLDNLSRLILVYGNTDYAFNSVELSWIDYAKEVIVYESEDCNLFFINMKCNPVDSYIYCAAIIKLVNVAFPGENLFFFRIDEALRIGCARSFKQNIDNNFVVSGLISEDNCQEYEGLFDELMFCDLINVPSILMDYSPQEDHYGRNYDKQSFNSDYFMALDEIENYYGENLEKEKQEYLESYDENNQQNDTYYTACQDLKNIVDRENTSSYEDLNKAIQAEKKSKNVILNDRPSVVIEEDELSAYSKEAYNDAEKMLKEMMKNN